MEEKCSLTETTHGLTDQSRCSSQRSSSLHACVYVCYAKHKHNKPLRRFCRRLSSSTTGSEWPWPWPWNISLPSSNSPKLPIYICCSPRPAMLSRTLGHKLARCGVDMKNCTSKRCGVVGIIWRWRLPGRFLQDHPNAWLTRGELTV